MFLSILSILSLLLNCFLLILSLILSLFVVVVFSILIWCANVLYFVIITRILKTMAFQIKYDVKFHKCYESRLPRRNNVTLHHEISDFSGVSVELTVFKNCKNNNYYYIIIFLNSSLYFWTDRFDSVVIVQLSNLVQSYVSAFRFEQQKFGKLCSALIQK